MTDPTNTKEWRAIALEAKLTRQLCGSGLTAVSRANYADGMGEYYNAFFSLSVGIERLAKLIFSVDHFRSSSKFPSEKELKSYGHRIDRQIARVRTIQSAREIRLKYGEAKDPICLTIVQCLDAFADAKRGRYANLGTLIDPNFDVAHEPIALWSNKVGQAILDKHFRGSASEAKAKNQAELIGQLMGPIALVRHTSEEGSPLNSIESASFRTAENGVMQKYGRYYSFLVVRHLSEVFTEMTDSYGYTDEGHIWFGHYEHFNTFTVPNEFGLRRKIWPLH